MEGKEMRLSIIVPMYKVAAYVERCIRSLANQDISTEEYEIICVNDGSPDNCKEIVERLQQEIPNLILLNQENQGVSMARNNAIAIAKGKYLLPIDPDDYVVSNCLKNAVDQAVSKNLDVLNCAFEIFDTGHTSIWRTDYSLLIKRVDTGYKGYSAVRGPNVKDPDRSWAILYKSALLKKYQIGYPRDVPFLEDGLFLGKVFSVAKRVGYSDDDFYQRTTRPGSATNSELIYSKKSLNGFFLSIKEVSCFESRFKPNVCSNLLNRVRAKFIFLMLGPLSLKNDIDEFQKSVQLIKSNKFNSISYCGLDGIYKILAIVYNLNPLLLFMLYRPILFLKSKLEK